MMMLKGNEVAKREEDEEGWQIEAVEGEEGGRDTRCGAEPSERRPNWHRGALRGKSQKTKRKKKEVRENQHRLLPRKRRRTMKTWISGATRF